MGIYEQGRKIGLNILFLHFKSPNRYLTAGIAAIESCTKSAVGEDPHSICLPEKKSGYYYSFPLDTNTFILSSYFYSTIAFDLVNCIKMAFLAFHS